MTFRLHFASVMFLVCVATQQCFTVGVAARSETYQRSQLTATQRMRVGFVGAPEVRISGSQIQVEARRVHYHLDPDDADESTRTKLCTPIRSLSGQIREINTYSNRCETESAPVPVNHLPELDNAFWIEDLQIALRTKEPNSLSWRGVPVLKAILRPALRSDLVQAAYLVANHQVIRLVTNNNRTLSIHLLNGETSV